MAALPPCGVEARDRAAAARENVAAYAQMLGVKFPQPAADTLLAAFAAMPPAG